MVTCPYKQGTHNWTCEGHYFVLHNHAVVPALQGYHSILHQYSFAMYSMAGTSCEPPVKVSPKRLFNSEREAVAIMVAHSIKSMKGATNSDMQ